MDQNLPYAPPVENIEPQPFISHAETVVETTVGWYKQGKMGYRYCGWLRVIRSRPKHEMSYHGNEQP